MQRLFSACLLLIGGAMLVTGPALAEEPKTFGDWGHQCDKAEEGSEELCYVFQNVSKKETGQLVLGARVAYRPDQNDPLLVVTVPLGSLLPPGAALTMEGIEPVQMEYFLCANEGCTTVATPIPAATVGALKKGEQAVVRVVAPNQKVIGLPLSLKGFTKALASLKK